MSADNHTQFKKEFFQLYLAYRRLCSQNIVHKVAAQKSFEEAIHCSLCHCTLPRTIQHRFFWQDGHRNYCTHHEAYFEMNTCQQPIHIQSYTLTIPCTRIPVYLCCDAKQACMLLRFPDCCVSTQDYRLFSISSKVLCGKNWFSICIEAIGTSAS